MSGHGHSHGSGGCDDHEHVTEAELAAEYSLYTKIDTHRVQCLNEAEEESGKLVFKAWDKRLDKEQVVESDCDEELLFNIPFTGNVKLKGVIVIGGEEDTHPSIMKLYKNRENMTFDDCGAEPEQTFELHRDQAGVLEYNTKAARFNSVNHLSIYFPQNFGADTSKVYYIGLKGDFTQAQRQGVVICNYEANANPADHKTNLMDNVGHQIS